MDKAFLKDLIEVGTKVAAAVVPGAPLAIEAAKSAASMLQRAKEMFDDEDQPEIEKTLNELLAKVNAHADTTIDKLRGN